MMGRHKSVVDEKSDRQLTELGRKATTEVMRQLDENKRSDVSSSPRNEVSPGSNLLDNVKLLPVSSVSGDEIRELISSLNVELDKDGSAGEVINQKKLQLRSENNLVKKGEIEEEIRILETNRMDLIEGAKRTRTILREKLIVLFEKAMIWDGKYLPLVEFLLKPSQSSGYEKVTSKMLTLVGSLRSYFCEMIVKSTLSSNLNHLLSVIKILDFCWKNKIKPDEIKGISEILIRDNGIQQASSSDQTPYESLISEIKNLDEGMRGEVVALLEKTDDCFQAQNANLFQKIIKSAIKSYTTDFKQEYLDEMILSGVKSATQALHFLAVFEGLTWTNDNTDNQTKLVQSLGLEEIIRTKFNEFELQLIRCQDELIVEYTLNDLIKKNCPKVASDKVTLIEKKLEEVMNEQDGNLNSKKRELFVKIKSSLFPSGYESLLNVDEKDWLCFISETVSPFDDVPSDKKNSFVEYAYKNHALSERFYLFLCDRTDDETDLPHRQEAMDSLKRQFEEFDERYEKIYKEYQSKKTNLSLNPRYACLLSRRNELSEYRRALTEGATRKNLFLLLVNVSKIYQKRKKSPFLTDLHDEINVWLKKSIGSMTEAKKILFKRRLESELKKESQLELVKSSDSRADLSSAFSVNLMSENIELKRKLMESEERQKRLLSEKEMAESSARDLRQGLESKHRELESKHRELESKHRELENKKRELESLHLEKQALEKKYVEMQAGLSKLMARNEALSFENGNLKMGIQFQAPSQLERGGHSNRLKFFEPSDAGRMSNSVDDGSPAEGATTSSLK